MKAKILMATALLALLAGCKGSGEDATNATSTSTAVAAPKGVVWTETTTMTPEGGVLMGNPNAAVKLIEYGSLSCGHCKEFSETATPELRQLVDKGTVSWEFRTFLLGPQDLAPSLLARCGGPGPFFPIADQMYVNQAAWTAPLQALTEADQQTMSALQPAQLAKFLADKMGLVSFVQQRGISAEKANACLADTGAMQQLETITRKGVSDFKVEGTPTFVLNGVTIKDFSQTEQLWSQLKSRILQAGG